MRCIIGCDSSVGEIAFPMYLLGDVSQNGLVGVIFSLSSETESCTVFFILMMRLNLMCCSVVGGFTLAWPGWLVLQPGCFPAFVLPPQSLSSHSPNLSDFRLLLLPLKSYTSLLFGSIEFSRLIQHFLCLGAPRIGHFPKEPLLL